MSKMTVFHSGNPSWITCTKAIGIAKEMQKNFPDQLDLEIHTTDSEAARGYLFKTSTTVFLDDKQIPLQMALSSQALEQYLQDYLQTK